MSDTVLVRVRTVSHSDKAAPTSRVRIGRGVYEAELVAAEKSERPSKYLIEKDQSCEGMTIPDAVKTRTAQKLAAAPS